MGSSIRILVFVLKVFKLIRPLEIELGQVRSLNHAVTATLTKPTQCRFDKRGIE